MTLSSLLLMQGQLQQAARDCVLLVFSISIGAYTVDNGSDYSILLNPVLNPFFGGLQYKKGVDKLEQVPPKATKMLGELEHWTCEERLRKLLFFSL